MRDSDMAIGGLVLLGIIGAFAYFLFPNLIAGILRGPSYNDIVRAQEHEITAFNRETEVILSYLQGSWTMKAFRRLDAVIRSGGYDDWVQTVKRDRDAMVRDGAVYIERQRPALEALSRSLETKLSLREKTKRSVFDLTKSPLDREIDALRAELDGKINEITRFLDRFAGTRRMLNHKALTVWFQRSLLVALVAAAVVVGVYGISVAARFLSGPKSLAAETKLATPRGFHATAPRQAGLITPIESPTLTDTGFHFTFQPKTGPIPEPISSVLNRLPRTNTALKLASILGGYPATPASRAHHQSESGGLILHTAKALTHAEPFLHALPDPRIAPVVILAHDIGKIATLRGDQDGRPHDIPSADIVASLAELREEFDEITARSMILAIRHQHAKAEMPLNPPPMTETILQFIKKIDLGASAEESREAAEEMRQLIPKVLEFFPYVVSELNVNGCMGGKAEGYLSDGYLYLCKEPVKERLLRMLEVKNAPVFKGQDPVWNEMALALVEAGLITTKIGAKEAGKKSSLFTIKAPTGQEKAVAIPVASVAPHLSERWLRASIVKIEVL